MENTNQNNKEPVVLITGIFKKRNWPWLFVLLAAILTVASYIQIGIEYFGPDNCCSYCTDPFSYYFFHYQEQLFTLLTVVCILIVLAILCPIIFLRKRILVITTTAILFKKGSKVIKIPLSTVKSIDTGATSLIVNIPFKKFKFAKLENKKDVYDTLYTQLTTPIATTSTDSESATDGGYYVS